MLMFAAKIYQIPHICEMLKAQLPGDVSSQCVVSVITFILSMEIVYHLIIYSKFSGGSLSFHWR